MIAVPTHFYVCFSRTIFFFYHFSPLLLNCKWLMVKCTKSSGLFYFLGYYYSWNLKLNLFSACTVFANAITAAWLCWGLSDWDRKRNREKVEKREKNRYGRRERTWVLFIVQIFNIWSWWVYVCVFVCVRCLPIGKVI